MYVLLIIRYFMGTKLRFFYDLRKGFTDLFKEKHYFCA